MEITRRFIKFLEELEDSQVQEKYLTPELEENLKTITQMISKLNLNAPRKLRSLNDLQIFEKTLVEGCSHIPQKLKKTIEAISVLHVFATNHPLTQDNVPQFLEEYCRNLFECHSISLLSSHTKMKNLPSTIDGVKSLELEAALKIVEELDDLMKEKMFHTLDASSLGGLEPFLGEKNYIGNIVLKLNEGQTHHYLIMHFKTDSPFTGSYITGKYYQDFPYSFNILIESVKIANHLMDKKTLIIFLGKLESLKLELIELHKRYFLSFIATELTTSLECEVYPTIVLGHQEDVINDLIKSDNKLIQMVLVEGRSLELLNNFDWDNTNLNQKLFILWEKLHKYLKIKEQGIFYHFYMERTFDVFLEFTKDNKLIYQSKPFENQDHRSLVDIKDFLKDPNARSVDVIMSKFKPALEMVHKYLDETRESKMLIFRKEGIWRNVHFEFIGKRKESKKVVEAFGIVLKEEKKPTKIVTFDSLIDNLTTINKSTPQHNMTLKAVRKLLSTRNVNPKNVLGENADINDLKKTIVSEYLPEELTSTNDETHKSISSVNRIKLDMTANTAFSDSPMLKKENSARVRVVGSPTSGLLRQEPFSPQNLISRKNDMEIFDNWSFDAIRIDDNDEKSRIVWAMLNESGLIREFKIQKNILCEFINRIQEGYNENKNPFHNYEHGITVMHGAFYILRHISTKFTNLVNLGTLISAFCHDVGHTGRNNIFEVNSMTKLAIRYHDKSVLEQHHAAITFKILNKETSNIFCNVKPEDFKQLRKLIISNILATDMKVHFDVTTAFEDLHGRIQASGEDDFAWNDDDVTTVTNMVLHCSDLCGPSKKFDVAHHWAQRINKEFSTQVREEEALGIPVTPYFKNLDKPEIMAKQEIAFISFMIKPLWVNFNKFVSGGMQIAVDNIEINLKEWNLQLEKALKQKEEEASPK